MVCYMMPCWLDKRRAGMVSTEALSTAADSMSPGLMRRLWQAMNKQETPYWRENENSLMIAS